MRTWIDINNQRIRYINYGAILLRRAFTDARLSIAKHWAETGDVTSLPGRTNMTVSVRTALEEMYASTGVAFAETELMLLKSGRPTMTVKADLSGVWRRHMIEFVRTRCGHKITKIVETYFDDIVAITQGVIRMAADEGWGAARVAREIMKKQGVIDDYRAMRIARTEVVGASNEGSYIGANATGIKTVKKWIATADANTRDDHAAMNGQQVPHEEPFSVGGESLMYPGDPSGSAAQVINCRCACSYRPETSYIDQLLNNE